MTTAIGRIPLGGTGWRTVGAARMEDKMKRWTAPIWAAAALFGVALASSAADVSTRQQIEAQYRRIREAFKEKSIAILDSVLAPDFKAIGRQRKKQGKPSVVHRQATLKGWKGWFTALKSIESQSHTIKSIKLGGDKAIAVTEWSISFTEDHGKQGLRHATYSGPSRDTWVKSPSGWQLLRIQDLPGGKHRVHWNHHRKQQDEGKYPSSRRSADDDRRASEPEAHSISLHDHPSAHDHRKRLRAARSDWEQEGDASFRSCVRRVQAAPDRHAIARDAARCSAEARHAHPTFEATEPRLCRRRESVDARGDANGTRTNRWIHPDWTARGDSAVGGVPSTQEKTEPKY